MDISQLTQEQFVDIFSSNSAPNNAASNIPKFGMSESNDVDLFSNANTTTTTVDPSTETTTLDPATETTTVKPVDDIDILDAQGKGAGRPPKYDFSDISGYFEDRMKKGLFKPIQMEDEKGQVVDFVPKTPEEFDEVLQLQIDNRLEEARKDLDQKWYTEKSPAWQLVAKYAENVNHPMELVPLLQGVQRLESIAHLDPTKVEDAERLVRMNLSRTGMNEELIDTQVEALKTTNKITEAGEKLKPSMLQAEQYNLALMNKQKQEEIDTYRNMVLDIRENAIKAIEQPLGKEKLKQEEKAAIYELIAEPDPETRGYQIFNKIDELFEKKDFTKLKKIALILHDEERYNTFIGNQTADKTAKELSKKLSIASETGRTGSNAATAASRENNQNAINRNQYGKPRFGR